MASSLSSYVFDDEGMTWITCDLCAGSFQRGSPAMEPNFVEFPTAISLQDPPLPRFKEAPLLHHLLRPEVASMAVLTEAQVASVSMVVVLDHFTSWQTMVSLAKKCLSGHV
ncbi:hypothetical protein FOC1_g10011009 [Fusarium oxysporum f. sp. cubense race 1]|uniref:Uncharacterized protein n=1 Tax=Fusarium oxysporum f. sp. cubense (strain race 1) TaxID=1229664 RepID=N4UFX6_FUSC1|nr:hypothetical protein FOC1_g10011009 [Fusarium oxysporum f. sp. cubense race 1]